MLSIKKLLQNCRQNVRHIFSNKDSVIKFSMSVYKLIRKKLR